MAQTIYGLVMSMAGAPKLIYCSIVLSSGTTGAGAISATPAHAGFTYAAFEGGITFQIPGGEAYAAAEVTATSGRIAGEVYVGHDDVAVQIQLIHLGMVIHSYEVPAGGTSGSFNWDVAATEEREASFDPKSILDQLIAPPPKP